MNFFVTFWTVLEYKLIQILLKWQPANCLKKLSWIIENIDEFSVSMSKFIELNSMNSFVVFCL